MNQFKKWAKGSVLTSPKRVRTWPMSTRKHAQHPVIGELQIKTRHYYTSIGMVKVCSSRNCHSLLVGKQSGTAALEDSLAVPYKIKHGPMYDLASTLPHIYPVSWKFISTQKPAHVCLQQLYSEPPQTGSKPRCPSVSERMSKLWNSHTLRYYSAMKRKERSSHEKTRKNLKCMLLTEAGLKRLRDNSNYVTLWKRKNYRDRKQIRGQEKVTRWHTEDF